MSRLAQTPTATASWPTAEWIIPRICRDRESHIDRGFRSMAAIALQSPVGREEMKQLILEAVRRNDLQDAYIKWVVTRGSNGQPLLDPTNCVPNFIILTRPYINRVTEDRINRGLRLKTVAVRRPPGQVLDPHIKSLNYLNLALAKIEAKSAGADEALILDIHGRVCEATGCNVFTVHGGVLRTPVHDILAGITRETVIELASDLGFSVETGDLELYDAYTADELFLSSSAGGILPVVKLDGRPIGKGNPGPVFRRFSEAYQQLISSDRYSVAAFDEVALGA